MPSLIPGLPSFGASAFAGAMQCPCSERKPMAVRLGLRSAVRPVFEGAWCCRPACLTRSVAASVRRGWTAKPGVPRHRHRMPLGLILLSQGVILQSQLQSALTMQRQRGGRLGDLLIQHFGISEDAITVALSVQWQCPVWAIRGFDPSRMARLAPKEIYDLTGLLPLRNVGGERLYVTFANGLDAGAALALERMHRIPVECGVSASSEVKVAQGRLAAASFGSTEHESFDDENDLTKRIVRRILQTQPVEARLVRVQGAFWLRTWLEPAALVQAHGTEDTQDVLFMSSANQS